MNGWVKLHRRLLENRFLRRDRNAYIVFTRLLLLADRKTGAWEGGREQLGEWCGLKPTTAYRAAKRCENAKMMTLHGNNKYTTYTILNYIYYQDNGDSYGDNAVTTRSQRGDNAVTLNKNKELRIKNKELFYGDTPAAYKTEFEAKYPDKDIGTELEKAQSWAHANGKHYRNWKQFYNYWLLKSDTKHTKKEGVYEFG